MASPKRYRNVEGDHQQKQATVQKLDEALECCNSIRRISQPIVEDGKAGDAIRHRAEGEVQAADYIRKVLRRDLKPEEIRLVEPVEEGGDVGAAWSHEELTMIALALKNQGIEDVSPERGVELLIEALYLSASDRDQLRKIAEGIVDLGGDLDAEEKADFLRRLAERQPEHPVEEGGGEDRERVLAEVEDRDTALGVYQAVRDAISAALPLEDSDPEQTYTLSEIEEKLLGEGAVDAALDAAAWARTLGHADPPPTQRGIEAAINHAFNTERER